MLNRRQFGKASKPVMSHVLSGLIEKVVSSRMPGSFGLNHPLASTQPTAYEFIQLRRLVSGMKTSCPRTFSEANQISMDNKPRSRAVRIIECSVRRR